jgi:hypothetical protein
VNLVNRFARLKPTDFRRTKAGSAWELLLAPQEAGHEGGVNFFLQVFVPGAVGDQFPDGLFPAAEEIAIFLIEALTFPRLVGEAHQAVEAGAGQEDDEGVLLRDFGNEVGEGLNHKFGARRYIPHLPP